MFHGLLPRISIKPVHASQHIHVMHLAGPPTTETVSAKAMTSVSVGNWTATMAEARNWLFLLID